MYLAVKLLRCLPACACVSSGADDAPPHLPAEKELSYDQQYCQFDRVHHRTKEISSELFCGATPARTHSVCWTYCRWSNRCRAGAGRREHRGTRTDLVQHSRFRPLARRTLEV